MRRLRWRPPRLTTIRPAERYLAAGIEEARHLGHSYVGTEHVLLALTREPEGAAARILHRFGVSHETIRTSAFLARVWAPEIDRDALAALGIDLETVRERLEEAFGPGALEQTRAGMLEPGGARIQCIAPRLKMALAYAVDRAGGQPVQDEHILLGMLSVPDSLGAHVLTEHGVSLEDVQAVVRAE
ncbi:MAG: Clp protease N-terminal domain-containing protein [Gaiellaceae bacterium]